MYVVVLSVKCTNSECCNIKYLRQTFIKMEMIIVLLILMNMASPGTCSKQVSVLKYKGGKECSSDLVGVPIKSTSSASSLLDEFTFCGKYYLRFVRYSTLMGIEPDLILKIWDFDNKVGFLTHQGIYYKFYFPNITVTPDSWQYICFTISSIQIKIVWNGEILLNTHKLELQTAQIKDTKLWLGGGLFCDCESNQRLGGMIAKAYFWDKALQDDDLISITTNKNVIASAKYDLLSNITLKNSSCMEFLILDENHVLFQGSKSQSHSQNLLFEFKTDFNSANYICESYGGNLTLPKNEEDLEILGHLIHLSKVCSSTFLGLKKSNKDEIIDLKDNSIHFLKWHLNQPNGGKTHKCIITYDSYVDDENCDRKYCFFCQIPEKSIFVLRGQIPSDNERKYFVIMNRKHTEIRGLLATECFWNERKWDFGMNLKLDNVTNNMPPVGLKTWNNGTKLKFTQCKKDEFTCYTYGHCIPLKKRCDGNPDCPVDGSDENECKIMIVDKGYDNRYPSKNNVTLFMSMLLFDILDMDELGMSYTIDFRIYLKWFEPRIVFRNLKPTSFENKLEESEIGQIWTPKLYIMNSYNDYVEAGQNINNPSRGLVGSVYIHREGSPQYNELSELDEDYLYPGHENPISMINDITIKLRCKIDLKW